MAKYIKNIDSVSHTWAGKVFSVDENYQIQSLELLAFSEDSQLLTDIANGKALVSDGYQNFTEVNLAINFLKDIVREVKVIGAPAFRDKTLVINGITKKLFARNVGKRFDLVSGYNELSYTTTFPWVKMIGLECIGAEIGDYAELRVYDSPSGTYSGVSGAFLNQFGYELNMAKDFYSRESPFDADVYQGMVLKISYTSVSAKRIGINYLMNEVKS